MKVMIVTDAWVTSGQCVVRHAHHQRAAKWKHSTRWTSSPRSNSAPLALTHLSGHSALSVLAGNAAQKRIREFDPPRAAHRHEGPLGLSARSLRDPQRPAIHHRLPQRVFPNSSRPAPAFRLAGPTAFPALVSRSTRQRSDGRHPGGQDRPGSVWLQQRSVCGRAGLDLNDVQAAALASGWTANTHDFSMSPGAVEKNVEAFLKLNCPVPNGWSATARRCAGLRASIPTPTYLGVMKNSRSCRIYAAADVFVFPSNDTFGLVLLEAMACGLPVAAYPVSGPIDVLGNSSAGVMHEDLRWPAWPRSTSTAATPAPTRKHSPWRAATEQFVGHLHPVRQATAPA